VTESHGSFFYCDRPVLFDASPSRLSALEKKSLLRDNVDLLVSLADVYFRAGDTKNAILKFEQAQMLDPYLIKGALQFLCIY